MTYCLVFLVLIVFTLVYMVYEYISYAKPPHLKRYEKEIESKMKDILGK